MPVLILLLVRTRMQSFGYGLMNHPELPELILLLVRTRMQSLAYGTRAILMNHAGAYFASRPYTYAKSCARTRMQSSGQALMSLMPAQLF